MEGPKAHIDFETRSATDLKKAGVYRYAEDPTTWPWGFRWRIGETGIVREWRPGFPDPVALLDHIRSGGIVACHNAAFERTIWNWIVVGRICPHWPLMTIAQQDCTMSRAAAIAHPQSLDALGDALKTSMRKDREGHALMMKMAKPRRFNEDGSITWWDDLELQDRNMTYCGTDVIVETLADELLPPLSPNERAVWEFDQLINERGVQLDMNAVKRCADLVAYAKKRNDSIMRDLTDRAVPKCSNDAKIITWLNARGVQCTSLAKGEVEDVVFMAQLANDDAALDVIKLRQAAWKTSTAKYGAMMLCTNSDGRVRGTLNYHGAGTGRWAGRLIQPQNFPRVDPDDELLALKIEWLHRLLETCPTVRDVYEAIVAVHGPLEPLELLSKALRSVIVAATGKKFIGGDFSNIEGRMNAWLAGETWKVEAFRDYDTFVLNDQGKRVRKGEDLYKLAYARSFGVDVSTVGKGQKRQIGKVQELALGFQGGIGAYIAMGATYGVNPFALTAPVQAATSAEQWDKTAARYHYKGAQRHGLFEAEWTALQILVDNWRAANAAIVQSWWNYQDAAIEAVAAPGNVVYTAHTNKVAYYSDGRCLWCILPSGRMLCYAAPELVQVEREYTVKDTGEVRSRLQRHVTYEGVDSRTRQWTRAAMYGGLLCENVVQAAARDVMVDAMFRVEAAGYPVVLTVHDELLTEVDLTGNYNETHFAAVMSETSTVYDGLPVSVSAWEDTRYVK